MEGGRNANYWPGFVDALGNTIIAMVFVVIVLAISLAMYVKLLAERQAERLVAQRCTKEEKGQAASVVPPVPVAAPGKAGVPGVPAVGATEAGGGMPIATTVLKAAQSAGKENPAFASIREKGGVIEVVYAGNVFDMDASGQEQFRGIVEKMRRGSADVVDILILASDMQYTENQRAAFTRAMTLRNQLIGMGYTPSQIRTRTAVAPGRSEEMVVRVAITQGG